MTCTRRGVSVPSGTAMAACSQPVAATITRVAEGSWWTEDRSRTRPRPDQLMGTVEGVEHAPHAAGEQLVEGSAR